MDNFEYIGSIDFTNYCEEDYSWEIDKSEVVTEDQIGKVNLKSLGNCKILVWTGKEGDYIPHCHIKVEDEHDICVRLDKAELFDHSNNDNTFHNNGEKKIFDNFMNKKRSDGRTNWEYAVDIWNKGNKIKIDKNIISKPDYTKIK